MPLLAALSPPPDVAADLRALLDAGWRVEITDDGSAVAVHLRKDVDVTGADVAEALAAARARAGA